RPRHRGPGCRQRSSRTHAGPASLTAAGAHVPANRTSSMTDSAENPILVTGVPGRVGGVGSAVVEILRGRGLRVGALARREDERTDALRASGVEIVVGDLTQARDVAGALSGCRRMYFGMGVSSRYLEATVTTAAAAREHPDLEVLVNIS